IADVMDGVTAAGGGSGAGDGCNDGRHPKKEQRQRWDVHLAYANDNEQ
ncbi:hypothetical protein LINGRAHAP2_LOCUS36637, partial [Linum grandiflorum]